MSGLRERLPNPFDLPSSGRGAPDILADERERRRTRGRIRRFLSPSWWLEGKRGVVALAVFIVGGLAAFLAGVMDGSFDRQDPIYAEVAREPALDAGRRLNGVERNLAGAYGEPMYLGAGGLPVVQHEATGEIRELTPLEQAFFERSDGLAPDYLETGRNGVVWNPGTSGWGMWWKPERELDALRPVTLYPRSQWRDKQAEELAAALAMLTEAVDAALKMNLELWDETVAARIGAWVDRLEQAYPLGSEMGMWAAVPGQWVCDDVLEAKLNLGITQGCPPETYSAALGESWHQIGRLTGHLAGMVRLGQSMDHAGYADLEESGLYRRQYFYLITLAEIAEDLSFALGVLLRESVTQELAIDAGLYQDR